MKTSKGSVTPWSKERSCVSGRDRPGSVGGLYSSPIHRRGLFKFVMACLMTSFLMLTVGSPVGALEFKEGDFELDLDTTLSYSAALRAQERSDTLLRNINADDGNRNFKKWDFVTNRGMVTMDIDAKYKAFGAFLRPRAFYDDAYNDPNSNASQSTNNNLNLYGGSLGKTDHFTDKTKDVHRDQIELLDAFVYGSGNPFGHQLDLRVGRQVVSWGESLFLQNGISSAQSPLDATQAYAPGVELRDIFLPTGQVLASLGLGSGFSVSGYYQWEWMKSRLPEAGSFYSTVDYLDDAGKRILVPVVLDAGLVATIDRGNDKDAKDQGQWGGALRYLASGLNNTEFGLYYLNYHAKVPEIRSKYSGGTPSPAMKRLGGSWTNIFGPGGAILDLIDTSSYWTEYPEDIHLIGFSVGTVIGDANVGFEVSYRPNVPMAVNDPDAPLLIGFKEGEYTQAQLSVVDLFPATMFYDQLTLTGEIGCGIVSGIGNGEIYDAFDRWAWGFVARAAFDWFNVFPGIDFNIPITYVGNPNGTSPLGTFTEHADSLAVELGITYQKNFKASIGYAEYLYGPRDNPLADRDYVYLNMKYTF